MPIPPRERVAAGMPVLAALLLALAALGCSRPDSDYFGPNQPTWVRVPTTFGDAVYAGIIVLHAQPADRVELDSIVLTRLGGNAVVEPIVSILRGETRLLGGVTATGLREAVALGEPVPDLTKYQPLQGTTFTEADGPVAFAVRVTGSTPEYGFDGVTLRYSLNGSGALAEDWIPMRLSICAGRTLAEAVETCRATENAMHSFGQ